MPACGRCFGVDNATLVVRHSSDVATVLVSRLMDGRRNKVDGTFAARKGNGRETVDSARSPFFMRVW